MKFENTQVMNFEGAFRGMRNSFESWIKSDSSFGCTDFAWNSADYDIAYEWCKKEFVTPDDEERYDEVEGKYLHWLHENGILKLSDDFIEYAYLGPVDLNLAQRLVKAGPSHRKFLRQIMVSVDITAPLYWWKEFDTYKIGTVANSTSTMHKLATTPITIDCFDIDDYDDYQFNDDLLFICNNYQNNQNIKIQLDHKRFKDNLLYHLEALRLTYLRTKDKRYWKELIRWLPESWLQTRTVTFNYENLLAICSKGQRRFHKLNEWSGQDNPALPNFISWARTLPYAQELIFIDEIDKPKKES